jgi:putative cell wall-binding protein
MSSYNFVTNHLAAGGSVTIVGGTGVISPDSEAWLHDRGLHVRRLGGRDLFATNSLIVNQLNVPKGTPVILASGNDFPDALGISSLAASKGWPILLSDPSNLTQSVQNFLSNDQPTEVYVIGGEGILHNGVYNQIQTLSPKAQVQRLGGYDRFETLALILNKFYPNPAKIYVANGYDFADALSGSTLAATQNAPILLVNPWSKNLPKSIKDYLTMLNRNNVLPQVNVLGGEGAVPQRLVDKINSILENTSEDIDEDKDEDNDHDNDKNTEYQTPSTETLTVSNPLTTGFTVTVNPAINDMTVNDFTLHDNWGNPVAITNATSINNGGSYILSASLNSGQAYTLTAVKTGYTFGAAQSLFVPTTTTSTETLTVSNPSTTGFTVTVNPAINNMTINDFTLHDNWGNPVAITNATSINNGGSYFLSASLNLGQVYTLTTVKTGYTFGTAQYVFVPATTPTETLTVSNPTTTGFALTVNPALNGLNVNDFILMDGGTRMTINSVSTTNSGFTYNIAAPLTAGHVYSITAAKNGYFFGTAQNVVVPFPVAVLSAVIPDSTHIVLTMNYNKTGSYDLTNGAPVANFSFRVR